MTVAKVTYANLFSESWNNLKSLIETNVSDPTISAAEHRKWIYSRMPDVKASDFAGYPFIIVNPSDVDVGDKGSVDGKSKNVFWFFEVEIVTSDRGYGGKDMQGLSVMDSITDSVVSVLLNKTHRKTLQGNSLYFSKPETTGVSSDIIQNERVYKRSVLCPFRSRMQVSA